MVTKSSQDKVNLVITEQSQSTQSQFKMSVLSRRMLRASDLKPARFQASAHENTKRQVVEPCGVKRQFVAITNSVQSSPVFSIISSTSSMIRLQPS